MTLGLEVTHILLLRQDGALAGVKWNAGAVIFMPSVDADVNQPLHEVHSQPGLDQRDSTRLRLPVNETWRA